MMARRRLFWASAWLAVLCVAIKAYYLGAPAAPTPRAAWDYIRDLAVRIANRTDRPKWRDASFFKRFAATRSE